MQYIQDENGVPVNGHRAKYMREIARGLWEALANSGKAPATWHRGPLETKERYNHEMALRFPELRYCAQDWKAEQIAIDNYPSFHSKRFPKSRIKTGTAESGACSLLTVSLRTWLQQRGQHHF
jgi:hypothetical protein